jgi:predicted RNA methylase
MPSQTLDAQQFAAHLIAAAAAVSQLLRNDAAILTRSVVNEAMSDAFGSTSRDGIWTQRDGFQMCEIATITALMATELSSDPTLALDQLESLEARLPTQTVRSEDQVALQHFSTPVGLTWVIAKLAALGSDDRVLEPSAGVGMLGQWARESGQLHLNEIDPVRKAVLERLFPRAQVSLHDATRIGSVLRDRPTVVIMNPPFSRNASGHADATVAAKHFAAALASLAPGGRLVAVMPDSFGAAGSHAESYKRAVAGATIRINCRLPGAFKKQGTSVLIRVIVADKGLVGSHAPAKTIHSVSELLAQIPELPDRLAVAALHEPDPVAPKATVSGLFRGFGASRNPALRPLAKAPAPDQVRPVEYQIVAPASEEGKQVGVYVAYRPQRLQFPDGADHPSPLVESAAMASVALPVPTYKPILPARVIEDQALSSAQLETVVQALDATSQDLPGKYKVREKGIDLDPHAEGQIFRRGFFLGDGTGAGKGRQLAAIVMDQWLRGNRRHLWISESNALIEDARRDWQALGGTALDIRPLAKLKPTVAIAGNEGIVFLSYATLRSGTGEQTRLQQLLEWLGASFDGLILFDEAHAMGGVAGGEGRYGAINGSQQGIAGVELQNRLPRARIVYASATGASDINNLAYAGRLGLWGEGTAFPDRISFISRIREGGIAAMELVARELKGMGVYTARALSYAGVEYDILEHALTGEQIRDFDAYAEAWAIIHRNMEQALGLAGVIDRIGGHTLNGQALSAARSRFESAKQRFFGQLLLSLKLPTLLPSIDEALAADQSVVVQLVSTSEALLGRRLADLDAEDRAELALDLSPRELVLDYLENAFPTRAMESFFDDDGNERSRPLFDEVGNPVHCEEALRIKAETIELLGALPPIVPALDAVIVRYGAESVAEVTGRTRRLITLPDGRQKLQPRSASQSLADANAFMAGTKRVIVFSDAGGTGRSYHASLDCSNQQRRVHFLLEPGWRADRAIQGLGRTNRTHQASAPIFRPVTTDCRGERRFISTIARRLDSLGALTRGQRQTGGQNLFDPADNLESEYAREALVRWYHLLHQGKLQSIPFDDFCERTGLKLEQDGSLVDNLPPIQRWLNRILALPIRLQNAIFDEFLGLVEARIDAARKAGTYDAGVETLVADKLTIVEERTLREDAGQGATTQLLTIEAQWAPSIVSLTQIHGLADRRGQGARFLRNSRSGRVALLVPDRTRLAEDGTPIPSFQLHRPRSRNLITADELAESSWEDVERSSFDVLWEKETADLAAKPHTERFFMATGRLLPIWNLLGDEAQVRRLVTNDGRSLLGRIVPIETVNALLAKLGVNDRIKLSASEVVSAAMAGEAMPLDPAGGLSLRRSRVNGEARLEIVGFDPRSLASWKAKGCFTEIIQFKTRLFVPVTRATEIVDRLAA